uniref:Dehydrogenase/reductase SDR family member 11 n=1 Tax=Lygus hesperus TaxID=30085 RepID=A0A0A9ZFG6_LYGHE
MPALKGKVAVVTGASSGIGEAIVKELVGAGMIVAGLARRVERVEALVAALKGEPGKLSAVKCDVTKEEDVKNAFAWVKKNLGPPSVVINNAGVLKQTMISSCDLKDVQLMFDTNVVGLIACAREALSSMVENKTEGTIVNINSVAGHFCLPFPGIASYNGSKFAITALTEGLRSEVSLLGANVRVTSLSPGAVESEMTDQFKSKDKSESVLDSFEMLPAKDIADCVLFILQSPQRMNISELTVLSPKETLLTQAKAVATMIAQK